MADNNGGFNASEVSLVKGPASGYAFCAPAGTALPKNVSDQLDPAFLGLGYIDNNGIVNATTLGTTAVTELGGKQVKSEVSSYAETYQFTLIQTNENTLKVRFGTKNVIKESDGSLAAYHTMPDGENLVFVFDLLLSPTRKKRTVIPLAHLTACGSITNHASGALGYQVTYTPEPSELLQNNATSVDYFGDIASAASTAPASK